MVGFEHFENILYGLPEVKRFLRRLGVSQHAPKYQLSFDKSLITVDLDFGLGVSQRARKYKLSSVFDTKVS